MPAKLGTASILVVSALVFAACGGTGGNGGSAAAARSEFPMTVDNCGRKVTFDKRPERVLAMDPEAATLLAEAGAADRIRSYAGFTADVPFGKRTGP